MRISTLSRPAHPRFVGLVLVATVLSGLSGCGDDSADTEAGTVTSLPVPSATASALPTASATPSASAPAPATPSRTPRPPEGDGDGEGDGEPAAAGGGICVDLSEAEIGSLLGGSVTGSAIPGGGCAFTQQRPRRPAANLIELPFNEVVDGIDGAKQAAISTVEGDPETLAGIGEEAFVVTGTSFGGTEIQGAGGVRIGNRLITVNLAQNAGLSRAKVRALVVGLLQHAASKAG